MFKNKTDNGHRMGAVTFAVLEQQVPDSPSGIRIYSGCGLVQNHHLGTSYKGYGHRQLPLHPTYKHKDNLWS